VSEEVEPELVADEPLSLDPVDELESDESVCDDPLSDELLVESELDGPLDDALLPDDVTPVDPEVVDEAIEAEDVDVAAAAPPRSAEVVSGPPE